VPPPGPPTTTTFLFTDIEGSTRQWEIAPEMHRRVEAHFVALRGVIEGAGGRIFATMGDGVAAAFRSAEAALRAAVDAQQQMPALGLAVRMGIHTGEAEPVGEDFRGRPVNRAARIMAAGHGGQILVSDVTAALLRTGANPPVLVDLGRHRLRDLAEPERLWQVRHPALSADLSDVRSLDSDAPRLPVPRSSLVGRDQDVQQVVSLTEEHRIVTLTGVGGVGKTRLALHAAAILLDRFDDVRFVELAAAREPGDVADAIARAVGATAFTDAIAAAVALVSGELTLLVVDNCEHVVGDAAGVIDNLVARCPRLSVLATSREPLHVDGEHVVAVGTLDPTTTAVELFKQRAASAGAELPSTHDEIVEELCWRLDGIPLAIELAAARAATLGLAAIVDTMDEMLDLRAGRDGSQDRHATMRATLEWSFRLLSPDEQRMLAWLAVFPSGFPLDAAVHVASSLGLPARVVTDHVSSLVHKSMLSVEPDGHGHRYRLLETVRAFGLEQLTDGGTRDAALHALASWVTTLTDLPYSDCCSAEVERSSRRLEREADSWRESALWAAHVASGELAARLCGPPVAYFLLGRLDLADVVRPLLQHCAEPRERRAVLCALIVSTSGSNDPQARERWADEIEQIEALEPTGLGGLMRWLVLAWEGDFAASVKLCVEHSLDARYREATRDMFVGIAVLDHFSLTGATDDTYGLIDRALRVAERSDVALVRASCRLGAAWGLAATEPERSLRLVRRARDDIPQIAALPRLTMPGNAARLLAQLDPRLAAQGLLEQLDPLAARRSFVDLIPLFYAVSVLERVGHPSAPEAKAVLTTSPIAPYLSMMESVDLARRASSASGPDSLGDLTARVRTALAEIVAGNAEPALAGRPMS
jgi:predicted ATPase/class 3 adenylate cyclase